MPLELSESSSRSGQRATTQTPSPRPERTDQDHQKDVSSTSGVRAPAHNVNVATGLTIPDSKASCHPPAQTCRTRMSSLLSRIYQRTGPSYIIASSNSLTTCIALFFTAQILQCPLSMNGIQSATVFGLRNTGSTRSCDPVSRKSGV